MGLFTSLCPDCLREVSWFLEAPKNYVCACGRSITPEEIEHSWWNQVYQGGGNPAMLKNLERFSLEQLEEMLASTSSGEKRSSSGSFMCSRYVKSPIEDEDLYFAAYIIEVAIEMRKRGEKIDDIKGPERG